MGQQQTTELTGQHVNSLRKGKMSSTCLKCKYWNEAKKICEDPVDFIDPETEHLVCRYRIGAVTRTEAGESVAVLQSKITSLEAQLKICEDVISVTARDMYDAFSSPTAMRIIAELNGALNKLNEMRAK